jgi:signal transduction histidine kinase
MTARMILLNALLVIVTAVTVSTVLHYVRCAERVADLGQELEHMAAIGVQLVDADAHARVRTREDARGGDFARVQAQLQTLTSTYGLPPDAIYTLRPVAGASPPATEFVAMLGEPYTGDRYALPPAMARAVAERRPTHTAEVYEDRYGRWLSGYAPIVTSEGRVDGVLEVDYRADRVLELTEEIRDQTILYTLLCVLVAVALSALAMRWLLGPLNMLTEAIGALRRGNYEHRIDPASTASELEVIASTFNGMVDAIARRDAVLSASEQRYRALFSAVQEVIFVVCRDSGRVIDANGAAELFLEMPREALLRSDLLTLLGGQRPDAPRVTDLGRLREILRDGERAEGAERSCGLVRHSASGAPRFYELHAAPLEFEQAATWLVTCRDVTRQREEWAALLQASKLAAIGEMAGGLAHQINNPLVGVLNFAQLLRRRLPAGDPNEALAATIEEAAGRCRDVVRALLRFGRPDPSTDRAEVDLRQVIEEAVILSSGQLDRLHGVARVELPEALPVVLGNRTQLTQALLNLINNAVQAAGEGAQVTLRATADAQLVHIDVLDNGPGVPEHLRDRIFEPFFTTKAEGEGTGLGLSVAYGIAQQHGGLLSLRAGEPGGAFRLCLPTLHARETLPMPCQEPRHA